MSTIRIKLNHPFTAVPNHLVNNPDISANALAAITYLAGKPSGWLARSYDIKKRFKWGDYTWRQVSLELRKLGLLSDVAHPDGKQLIFELHWDAVDKSVDNPVDKVCEPPVDFQRMQKPTVGNQRIYKERNTNKDLLERKTIIRASTNCSKIEQPEPQEQPERQTAKQSAKQQSKLSKAEKLLLLKQMNQLAKKMNANHRN